MRWDPSPCQGERYEHVDSAPVLEEVLKLFGVEVLRRLPSLERFWCSAQLESPPEIDQRLIGSGIVGTITEYGREEARSVIRLRCLIQSHKNWLCWTARDRLVRVQGWTQSLPEDGQCAHYWRDYWYLDERPLPNDIARKFAIALGVEKKKGWIEGNRNLELTEAARKLIQERPRKR